MKRYFPFLLILLLTSCFDQNNCVVNSTSIVKVDFATLGGVAKTSSFVRVQQDSLGSTGAQALEFTVFETDPVGSVQLPLDPTKDVAYYSFLTTDSTAYKLAFTYTRYSRVISTTCGAFLYFKDLKVVKEGTTFDSTRVIAPELFTSVTSNVKLFF